MNTQNDIDASNLPQISANLTKLADFIQQRKGQKALLKAKNNSLSKLIHQKADKKQKKEKILQLFDKLNEQLVEGHTIYDVRADEQNAQALDALVELLTSDNWASLISDDNAKASQQHNTPIIIQRLSNTNASTNPGDGYIFWLHRQWYAEQSLAKQLMKIATRRVGAFEFEDAQTVTNKGVTPNAQQQIAIRKASQHALSIIIGGPGTGKTFTVAKLVTSLQQGHEAQRRQDPNLPPLSITLTAPTGKAAQRMQESLQKSLQDQNISLDNAKTLHRLLGIGSDGAPRYHANNPLPDDLIIVDEASMLGLELASQLVDAIKPTGRLILLGDANQLAAVDAGSVLADLCEVSSLQSYITELTESKRFDANSIVGQFAQAIQQQLPRSQKIKSVAKLLQWVEWPLINARGLDPEANQSAFDNEKIPYYRVTDTTSFDGVYRQLAQPYQQFFALIQRWYSKPVNIFDAANRKMLFEVFDSYRILCAGHQGQLGTQSINRKMSQAFTDFSKITRTSAYFYHGLPIIIQSNDYQLGLFNGDIAICLLFEGQLYACFAEKVIPTQRLSRESCDYAYAITIHKSQGSEFDNVAICIDKAHTRLLSQALIYTAVTRSKSQLSIFSPQESFEMAITQQAVRQTGLQLQFDAIKHRP